MQQITTLDHVDIIVIAEATGSSILFMNTQAIHFWSDSLAKGVAYVMHPTAKPNRARISFFCHISGLIVNSSSEKFNDNISCFSRFMG